MLEGSKPSQEIHPAPGQFSSEQLTTDPILHFFHYAHLPEGLQSTSRNFCNMASIIVDTLPRNAERSVALRKLLEAKDAAVRANVGRVKPKSEIGERAKPFALEEGEPQIIGDYSEEPPKFS